MRLSAVFRRYNSYQIAIFLSSSSMAFGILREFLLVGLLGFTARNDLLQIYLSIFYTIGLTIDAMRLACLNLVSRMSLPRLIFSGSLIALPFSVGIGLVMSYSTGGLNQSILAVTILGSYLNLIATLLITYKQRQKAFLAAQVINVLPNFILIPGILGCYWLAASNAVFAIVVLTSFIPVVQCFLLLLLPNNRGTLEMTARDSLPVLSGTLTFANHFSAMLGEQLFQIVTRAAFFKYGAGYLSIFAIINRTYAALRFILIDSYIGSKLAVWKKELQASDASLMKMINSDAFALTLALVSLLISLVTSNSLLHASFQILPILIFGFYFSTLVRIIYFKINHQENNTPLIRRFAGYELLFAGLAFLLTRQANYPLLAVLWIGYVAKPFAQILFLRKRFYELATS